MHVIPVQREGKKTNNIGDKSAKKIINYFQNVWIQNWKHKLNIKF